MIKSYLTKISQCFRWVLRDWVLPNCQERPSPTAPRVRRENVRQVETIQGCTLINQEDLIHQAVPTGPPSGASSTVPPSGVSPTATPGVPSDPDPNHEDPVHPSQEQLLGKEVDTNRPLHLWESHPREPQADLNSLTTPWRHHPQQPGNPYLAQAAQEACKRGSL